VEGLDYVKASYHSIRGTVNSAWEKNGDVFQWEITVPGNATATVYIPITDKPNVTESGQEASSAKGVKLLRMENGFAVYQIGSGNYSFRSTSIN
jgi:alpha-L-rhamnosidase